MDGCKSVRREFMSFKEVVQVRNGVVLTGVARAGVRNRLKAGIVAGA